MAEHQKYHVIHLNLFSFETPHPARYLLPPTDSRSLGLASGDLPHCGQAGDSFPPEGLSAQRWPLGTSRTA